MKNKFKAGDIVVNIRYGFMYMVMEKVTKSSSEAERYGYTVVDLDSCFGRTYIDQRDFRIARDKDIMNYLSITLRDELVNNYRSEI